PYDSPIRCSSESSPAADGTVLCDHVEEHHDVVDLEKLHEPGDHDHDEHSHGLVDRSILRSRAGVKAVAASLGILAVAATAQLAIFALSSSVALLADLIHNFGDAPDERLAGVAVVLAIFVSACVALYATVDAVHPPAALDASMGARSGGHHWL